MFWHINFKEKTGCFRQLITTVKPGEAESKQPQNESNILYLVQSQVCYHNTLGLKEQGEVKNEKTEMKLTLLNEQNTHFTNAVLQTTP